MFIVACWGTELIPNSTCQDDLKKRNNIKTAACQVASMDALEKWMIIWFTPHQSATLPKWMLFQDLFFKASLRLKGQCVIQVRTPTSSGDLLHSLLSDSYSILVDKQRLLNVVFILSGLSRMRRRLPSTRGRTWSWTTCSGPTPALSDSQTRSSTGRPISCRSCTKVHNTLLEKFCPISLYVTDDAIAKLYMT